MPGSPVGQSGRGEEIFHSDAAVTYPGGVSSGGMCVAGLRAAGGALGSGSGGGSTGAGGSTGVAAAGGEANGTIGGLDSGGGGGGGAAAGGGGPPSGSPACISGGFSAAGKAPEASGLRPDRTDESASGTGGGSGAGRSVGAVTAGGSGGGRSAAPVIAPSGGGGGGAGTDVVIPQASHTSASADSSVRQCAQICRPLLMSCGRA